MTGEVNSLNWFEIPVSDIKRAKSFYEKVFNIEMYGESMMGMAYFPMEPGNGKASGGLVQGDGYKPSLDGSKIYLNANPDMSEALGRVEAAGGKITMPKTKISDEIGYMAFFVDTEGNGMAMHSQN